MSIKRTLRVGLYGHNSGLYNYVESNSVYLEDRETKVKNPRRLKQLNMQTLNNINSSFYLNQTLN